MPWRNTDKSEPFILHLYSWFRQEITLETNDKERWIPFRLLIAIQFAAIVEAIYFETDGQNETDKTTRPHRRRRLRCNFSTNHPTEKLSVLWLLSRDVRYLSGCESPCTPHTPGAAPSRASLRRALGAAGRALPGSVTAFTWKLFTFTHNNNLGINYEYKNVYD